MGIFDKRLKTFSSSLFLFCDNILYKSYMSHLVPIIRSLLFILNFIFFYLFLSLISHAPLRMNLFLSMILIFNFEINLFSINLFYLVISLLNHKIFKKTIIPIFNKMITQICYCSSFNF